MPTLEIALAVRIEQPETFRNHVEALADSVSFSNWLPDDLFAPTITDIANAQFFDVPLAHADGPLEALRAELPAIAAEGRRDGRIVRLAYRLLLDEGMPPAVVLADALRRLIADAVAAEPLATLMDLAVQCRAEDGTPAVFVERLPHARDLPLPAYHRPGDAGMDLYAAEGPLVLQPGGWRAADCGIRLALPDGFAGQVRPRSGLALGRGITILNAPGTIDSAYRGAIKAILHNVSPTAQRIERGERIAQLVIAPVQRATLVEAVDLPTSTVRGQGGFGSTGI